MSQRGTPVEDGVVARLVSRLKSAIPTCKSEEDVRFAVEHSLRSELTWIPQARYEKELKSSEFRGFADAVHRHLVIEYKKPGVLRGKAARRDARVQLGQYLAKISTISQVDGAEVLRDAPIPPSELLVVEENLSRFVGVATDGERFLFLCRRGGAWSAEEHELADDTIEKLVSWLRGTSRKDLSPENLIADFGPTSPIASKVVGIFATLVDSGKHPKAAAIFGEWLRIFGIVYGTTQLERGRRSPETVDLAGAYHLKVGSDFSALLFSIHTYYALLMKLLVTELIVAQGSLADTFVGRITRRTLRRNLGELESGDVLQRYHVRNAIDQDFFGWYPDAWNEELETALWEFVQRVSDYDIGTFEARPERTRDLLKDLYHGLVPDSVRHALGEYYTPDWLAEQTIELAGYDGDPRKTVLDASCGSGTFLVLALQRARRWLADHDSEWESPAKKAEALALICHNVVGFDLNPLAVIASRTNYLFALGSLLKYRARVSEFELPVYLTDSVLLPGRTATQGGLFSQESVSFPMTVGVFEIPREVVDRRLVADLMNRLHEAVTERHETGAFVQGAITSLRLQDSRPLRQTLATLHSKMRKLDDEGRNKVWSRLIRNRYASLFYRHYFDFVVGNPPHVNWEHLTAEWRSAAVDAYRDYGLFTLKGLESQHGGGKKDIAALFTYAVADHFVKDGGSIALVLHVSLFKTSGAGEGFRRFRIGKEGPHLSVERVDDFKSFQPFKTDSDTNIKTRTVSARFRKGAETKFPVQYFAWSKTGRSAIGKDASWAEAQESLNAKELAAVPLRGELGEERLTPWLTLPSADLERSRAVVAPRNYVPNYRGREGINTLGLNGAFFVNILEEYPNGTSLIENMHDTGKIACARVRMIVERDLLYPLLRGRDSDRWKNEPNGHILVLQDPETGKGIAEAVVQQKFPMTWSYIRKFEKQLRARKAFAKFFDPTKDAFYSMYSFGPESMADHKVVWMDICSELKASVLSRRKGQRLVIAEHTMMFVSTSSGDEAHYLAAVLNTRRANEVVSGYVVDNHISTHPLENIVVPKFESRDKLHCRLVDLSQSCHEHAKLGRSRDVQSVAAEIDTIAQSIWES